MNPCCPLANWSIVRRLPWCIWCCTHLSFLLTLFPSGWVDFPGVTICQVGIEKSQFGPSKQVIKGAWPQLGLGEMCTCWVFGLVSSLDRILAHPAVLPKKKGTVTLTRKTGTIWHTAVSDCRNLWCQKICKLAICDDRKLYLSNLIGVTTS